MNIFFKRREKASDFLSFPDADTAASVCVGCLLIGVCGMRTMQYRFAHRDSRVFSSHSPSRCSCCSPFCVTLLRFMGSNFPRVCFLMVRRCWLMLHVENRYFECWNLTLIFFCLFYFFNSERWHRSRWHVWWRCWQWYGRQWNWLENGRFEEGQQRRLKAETVISSYII